MSSTDRVTGCGAVQESATLRPDAAAILQEVRRFANVYVIAHVADDMGEATVRGALEAGAKHMPPASPTPLCTLESIDILYASAVLVVAGTPISPDMVKTGVPVLVPTGRNCNLAVESRSIISASVIIRPQSSSELGMA